MKARRKKTGKPIDWRQLTFDFDAIEKAASGPSQCPLPKRVVVHTIESGPLSAHVVRHAEKGFYQIMLSRTFQRDDGTLIQTPAISENDVRLAQSLLGRAKAWIAGNRKS